MDEKFKSQIGYHMALYCEFLNNPEKSLVNPKATYELFASFYDVEPAKSYLGHVKMEWCPTCHNKHWHKAEDSSAICGPCQEKIKGKKMNEIVQRKLSMFEKFCIVHHISQGIKKC